MRNKIRWAALILVILLTMMNCTKRSISDAGYRGSSYHHPSQYSGELSELEVLGSADNTLISEEMIQSALKNTKPVSLRRGDTIVLIQSGASFPDAPMMDAMQPYFNVIPMSGIPEKIYRYDSSEKPKPQPIDKSLRLASARAGANILIVYWGVLESSSERHVTKTVSWVPIVGTVIPDETQHMRIQLKAAVIDVETGKWVMTTPKMFDDSRLSAGLNREASDQRQVDVLKKQAYKELADTIFKQFSQ